MEKIFKSASKIVLITISTSLSLAFLFVVFSSKVEGSEIADIFKFFLGAVSGFYFANKGETSVDSTYLGK